MNEFLFLDPHVSIFLHALTCSSCFSIVWHGQDGAVCVGGQVDRQTERCFHSLGQGLSWAMGSAGRMEEEFRAQIAQASAMLFGSFSC